MIKKKNINSNKMKKEYCNIVCLLCGTVIGGKTVDIPNIANMHAISLITGDLCATCNNKFENKVVCIAGDLTDDGRLTKTYNKQIVVEEAEYIKLTGKPVAKWACKHRVIVLPNEVWDELFTTFKTLN